jgi:signal peptidase II
MMKFWQATSVGFCVALTGFVADRAFKYIALGKFSVLDREFLLVGDILKFKLAYNPGVAFGIMIPAVVIAILFTAIMFVCVWLMLSYWRQRDGLQVSALLMIISGGASNMFDRIYFGHVVDYFDLKYYTIFNLADVMIFVGVIILIALIHLKKK